MSNFFAQPDALAMGKTLEELEKEGVKGALAEHKRFMGNKPSVSILFQNALTAESCGRLLAFYEHRVAIEGFIYGINSFDQWGVQLGKVLATDVRGIFAANKKQESVDEAIKTKFNPATAKLLQNYLK